MAVQKDNSLTISAPRQGIAQSPHVGFADVRNLDIYSIPGIVRLNLAASKLSGSVVTTKINWIERNPNNTNEIFALGNTGKVYSSADGGTTWLLIGGNATTNATGNGMRIFKNYLLVARNTILDAFGPLAGVSCTVSAATPAVISSTGHGLVVSTPIIFSGTSMPSGITAGTVYYVSNVNLLTDSFQIKDAIGGSQINTTTTGSGVSYRTWYAPNSDGVSTFKTIDSDVDWHPMIVSRLDGKLYGGEGNQVFTLKEVTTFNPISSGTYSWTNDAMTTALPSGVKIKCLEELGNNLMMGTWKGSTVTSIPSADIYTWDGSAISYGQPIVINDFGCHALLNIGGSLVCLVGTEGRIYKCDGVNAYPIAKLPIIPASGSYIEWYPGSICWQKGRTYFGSGSNGAPSGGTLAGQGIYSLQQTSQGVILTLEHLNSNQTDGTSVETQITALIPAGTQGFFFSWNSNGTYGIDGLSGYSYGATTFGGYFDSPLYEVGKIDNKRVFTQIGFQLAKKLATGEGIQISYRNNLTDSFTIVGTWTMDAVANLTSTVLGAKISHQDSAKIVTSELLQLRIALFGTSTTTPQLRHVTLE